MSASDIQENHVLHSSNGRFSADTSSRLGDVSRILREAHARGAASGLVMHFHGGLNSEAVGRAIAEKLTPRYLEAGGYPLFFVWESGAWESIRNNLSDVLSDPAFRELVKKVAEWSVKKLGGRLGLKGGPGQAINEREFRKEFDAWFDGLQPSPPVPLGEAATPAGGFKAAGGVNEDDLAAEIEVELDSDPEFQDTIQRLHNAGPGDRVKTKGAGNAEVPERVLIDSDALQELFPGRTAATKGALVWLSVAKFVAKLVMRVIKRHATGRAHGMYCTVVEEVLRSAYMDKVGAVMWNQMKKDTLDSFGTDADCCGSAVVNVLSELKAEGKTFSKITLVAHSTGALYICDFLDKISTVEPDLGFNIIFLAPAVRHDRLAAALQAHQARIANFRLFGMSDDLESNDNMVPILYPRSLLYFVSGLLEGRTNDDNGWEGEVDAPVVGMQRYLGNGEVFNEKDFPYVASVGRYLANRPDTAIWSESGIGDGRNSRSRKHGDFDDDPDTVASVAWMIKHGY
ncbi:hypothetical protein ACIP1U_23945 [Cupriavidus sp. NPDC089707]|uniref:hypothetical protein n=1 Tax=Cupriavidus sp. NPDC089707 TaxID=3363963 RepID=UPI0037FD4C65